MGSGSPGEQRDRALRAHWEDWDGRKSLGYDRSFALFGNGRSGYEKFRAAGGRASTPQEYQQTHSWFVAPPTKSTAPAPQAQTASAPAPTWQNPVDALPSFSEQADIQDEEIRKRNRGSLMITPRRGGGIQTQDGQTGIQV